MEGTAMANCEVNRPLEVFEMALTQRLMDTFEPMIERATAEQLDRLATLVETRRTHLADPVDQARRIAAFKRAAMELARESSGDDPLPAGAVLFYAIETESKLTGQPPNEIAAGDPAAAEALEEIARTGRRTHVMRGWLHQNWEIVSQRASTILNVEAITAAG
ncbi:hypothetical protein [Mycolicibacterium nivoides]|uniref:DUF222 domain-containing protein n=1 Tax=Mycolicibacterium nivoides TaxID=2487344 RepID=A0ABW9LL58_9MYCO